MLKLYLVSYQRDCVKTASTFNHVEKTWFPEFLNFKMKLVFS